MRGKIKRITVNLPPDLHMELKLHAVANNTTISNCVEAAIKDHLHHQCKAANLGSKSAD